jgi:alpha-mannosidase
MPFRSYESAHLQRMTERLAELRYRRSIDLRKALAEHARRVPDGYISLTASVRIPYDFAPGEVCGIFDFCPFGHSDEDEEDFEALCLLDGKEYQGVDQNHREVLFTDKQPGDVLDMEFLLWNDPAVPDAAYTDDADKTHSHEQHNFLVREARIALLDRDSDRLYHLLKDLLSAHEILPPDHPQKPQLLETAKEAWRRIDARQEGSDMFYASAGDAAAYLEDALSEESDAAVTVNMVGHTHIDVAWLWRIKDTREKCARSFSTVNRLMDRYSGYRFFQSQAQLYEFMKEDHSYVFEAIERRVSEGRWEASGGMWVEPDCNLLSGESLIRQILFGTRFFEDAFGSRCTFLWLPDSFGFTWALPQIMKLAGLKTFITSKLSWNDQNKMPNDTFIWKGIDGSEVLAYFITTPDPDEEGFHTYNGEANPAAVLGTWREYRNKELNRSLLLPFGYGDGGGGPTRGMLESAENMTRIPGLPHVRYGRVDEFCAALQKTVGEKRARGDVPCWEDELYLEFHRGVYTSQARNKAHNRRLEFRLRNLESLLADALVRGRLPDGLTARKDAVWKTVLCNQFHDILPGSGIAAVYADSEADYIECNREIDRITAALLDVSPGAGGGAVVWNTAAWSRDSVVRIPSAEDGECYAAKDGQPLPSCRAEDGTDVLLTDLKPFRPVQLVPVPGETAVAEMIELSAASIETGFYLICWDEGGRLTRLYDKELGREIIAAGGAGNRLVAYEDKPREYDAWEIESDYADKAYEIDKLIGVTCERHGDLFDEVCFHWEYGDTDIVQCMRLYNHTKRIDFVTDVDWRSRETLLRVLFPVDIRFTKARYDIACGNMERPATRNTSWEQARFEVPAHKWADVSEPGLGLSLMSDSKYGYAAHGDTISLTLLKSANDPDENADSGKHRFTYSLLPHEGIWYQAGIDREAFEINDPPSVFPPGKSFDGRLFGVDTEGLNIMCVKPSEDGRAVILRVHETKGAHECFGIEIGFAHAGFRECDLLERETAEFEYDGRETITFCMKPFEIKTFRIALPGR